MLQALQLRLFAQFLTSQGVVELDIPWQVHMDRLSIAPPPGKVHQIKPSAWLQNSVYLGQHRTRVGIMQKADRTEDICELLIGKRESCCVALHKDQTGVMLIGAPRLTQHFWGEV